MENYLCFFALSCFCLIAIIFIETTNSPRNFDFFLCLFVSLLWFYVVQVKSIVQMHSALHCSLRTARSKSLEVGRSCVFFVATLAGPFSRTPSLSLPTSLNVYIHSPGRGNSVCVHGSTEWMAESVCVCDVNEWVRSLTKNYGLGTASVFLNHILIEYVAHSNINW